MLLLTLLSSSLATVPLSPADYPMCGEPDLPDLCPADLNGDWPYLSYIPSYAKDSVREAELALGSGNAIDRAWRTTLGRWDVIVAVGDSGIFWDHYDLINKIYINVGEMPLPQDALGAAAATHDANGDGIVNVQDWASDPRVSITAGRDRADGVLDPSDLIYTFSDGVDDDGNGYADDIAGWDFFGRDNDAFADYTEGYGDHGTGVMREAGAEAGNGGDIGVCPNCAILPVRQGDTFITDGGRVAESILFAVDSGAVSIVLATGALSSSETTEAAVQYAWDNGVLVAGVTGDENSYHHNFPAVLDHGLYVHSITHDSSDNGPGVYSYMNTWNCNNFGERVTLVAASHACATGSAAVTGGVIGLVHSAARDAGIELSAGEAYQLLIQTATDVWLTDEERAISKAYPSGEGWDPFFGYGRINAAAAVERVAAGDIPPVADIGSPSWFQTFNPIEDATVEIVGTVSARSGAYTWTLEYGLGHDPRSWTSLGSGDGTEPFTGTLGELDLADVPPVTIEEGDIDEGIVGRLERVGQPAVTVRLRVTDTDDRVAEMRKTFFAHHEPDMMPGFPFSLGGSGEASPILADLNGDDVFEIIVATGSGQVLAIDGSGGLLPGFPVNSDVLDDLSSGAPAFAEGGVPPLRDSFLATPAVGDLDGDGAPEIVAAGIAGGIYAWHADGSVVDGFPVYSIGREPEEFDGYHTYDQGFAGAPTLYDLDGDGTLEVIVAGLDSRLYALTHDGGNFGPYPLEICHPTLCGVVGTRIINSPTIGDVDADGDPDIGLGTNEGANDGNDSVTYLIDALTGEALPGWPRLDRGLVGEAVLLPLVGEGHPSSLAFADIDGDGDLEISNPVMLGSTDVLHHDGLEPEDQLALNTPYYEQDFPEGGNADIPSLVQMVANPSFGDLDGDGVPDLVMGGASTLYLLTLAARTHIEYQQGILAWSGATGAIFEGWPRQIEDIQFLVAPAIADVSGDGKPEAIMASGGYLLHAWDSTGQEAPGWPKFNGNWALGSPAVGDIDGDGYLDVVVTTREGWLFAWTTAGRADQDVQWQSIHHDPQNTGNYSHPLASQPGPAADPKGKGDEQGCCKGGGDKALLALPLALLGWRRRRRA